MSKAQKTAVILFNLGGPDKAESIKPFLFNFFMDKNIIGAPKPIRWLISKLISNRRSKKEAGESYGFLGGGSPLLKNTQAQAEALQVVLPKHMKVFVSMRYWHPMSEEVLKQIKKWGAKKIILLPLYPQYSTTTSFSSIEDWQKTAKKLEIDLPTKTICCYPWQAGWIEAGRQHLASSYNKALFTAKEKGFKPPRILFSAHGLPEKIIQKGDPYQWQCEQTAQKLADALMVEGLDWQICYQSRVGPLKWIGPSVEEALEKAAADQVPVIIYPHAFVSEHVETLVELDIEYRHLAKKRGIVYYDVVPTVSVNEAFIQGLGDMVKMADKRDIDIAPDNGERLCPNTFKKCPCAIMPEAA